jgi:pyrrolidone-carboxylate peptidase
VSFSGPLIKSEDKLNQGIQSCEKSIVVAGFIHAPYEEAGFIHAPYEGAGFIHAPYEEAGFIHAPYEGAGFIHVPYEGAGFIGQSNELDNYSASVLLQAQRSNLLSTLDK